MHEAHGLRESHTDVLREIGSIGAGHAATALSQLIDRKVLIDVPGVSALPVVELPTAIMSSPETPVVAVYVKVLGDVAGAALFILERDSALRIAHLLEGQPGPGRALLDEAAREVLRQAGALLVGAYLQALGRLAGLTVRWSPPSFAFDMVGAILGAVTVELGVDAEIAIVIDTTFSQDDEKVAGRLIFIPTLPSLDLVLTRLGVTGPICAS